MYSRKLAIAVVSALVMLFAVSACAFAENWIDSADTSWYESNPEAETFTINSAEELAGLAKLVNEGIQTFEGKTVQLGGDIDLSGKVWTAVGGYNGPNQYTINFVGTFDGQGYTISGLGEIASPECQYPLYLGLFGHIHVQKTVIKNINVVGNIIPADTTQKYYIGGIIGGTGSTNWSTTNTIIENCSFSGSIKNTTNGDVGGIAAFTYSGIKNCRVNADITSAGGNVGGIAGQIGRTIENCYFKGTISGSASRAGGIVGYSNRIGEIINCVSVCNIDLLAGNAGGVVGEIVSDIITGCAAEGDIRSSGNAGGLIGLGQVLNIEFSSSDCKVVSTSKLAGGIVGRVGQEGNSSVTISSFDGCEWLNDSAQAIPIIGNIDAVEEELEKNTSLKDKYTSTVVTDASEFHASSASFPPIVRLIENTPLNVEAGIYPTRAGNRNAITVNWSADATYLDIVPYELGQASLKGLREGTGEIIVGLSGFLGENAWTLKSITNIKLIGLTSMTLDKDEVTLSGAGSSVEITAAFSPDGVSYPVLDWTYEVLSGDGASADDIELNYLDGSAKVRVTLKNCIDGAQYRLHAATIDGSGLSADVTVNAKAAETQPPTPGNNSGGSSGGCSAAGYGILSIMALAPLCFGLGRHGREKR